MKFQANVEGLLQALTRKHILSLGGGAGEKGAGGRALWEEEREPRPLVWCGLGGLLLACLLLKVGCILTK